MTTSLRKVNKNWTKPGLAKVRKQIAKSYRKAYPIPEDRTLRLHFMGPLQVFSVSPLTMKNGKRRRQLSTIRKKMAELQELAIAEETRMNQEASGKKFIVKPTPSKTLREFRITTPVGIMAGGENTTTVSEFLKSDKPKPKARKRK